MEILGYIVQYFNEDSLLPQTGYKHLYKTYSDALSYARTRVQEYVTAYENILVEPYEMHSPTKKQTDDFGYSVVFRNSEIQVWIEVIIN